MARDVEGGAAMLLAVVGVFLAANETTAVLPATGEPTHLDWSRPVACVSLQPTKQVPSGLFRVQCDGREQRCFAAPTHVLVEGVEGPEPLSRVSPCSTMWDDELHGLRSGWPVEEAIAEAPPGWYRDARGRVMQVNFDLGRRVFFGGAWAPYFRPDGTGFVAGRARVEFGGVATVMGENTQHRFHFFEASGWLGSNLLNARFEASVLRYDTSSRRAKAPLWLTTFVGTPRRFDVPLNLGWSFEAGRFEALGGRTFITFAEADATLDLWNSEDLDSYLRVRLGPGLEYDVEGRGVYLRPAVAVEGDFTLDRDGFHHLTATVQGEKLFFEPADAGRGASPQRLRLKAGYEVIVLALNDYPLSVVVDGRATWRDDVPLLKGWEFSGNLGLRFSFWAPARHRSAQVFHRDAPFSPPPPREPVPAPVPVPTPVEPAPTPIPESDAPLKDPSGLSETEQLIRAAKRKLQP